MSYLSTEIVKCSHRGTFKKPWLEKQSQNAISAKESVCPLLSIRIHKSLNHSRQFIFLFLLISGDGGILDSFGRII